MFYIQNGALALVECVLIAIKNIAMCVLHEVAKAVPYSGLGVVLTWPNAFFDEKYKRCKG